MDFFTGTHPVLLSEKTIERYNKLIEEINGSNTSFLKKIFNSVIYPNLGLIIVIIIIISFLYYRYRTKKETFGGMDMPNERIVRPTFNPYYPTGTQNSHVNYLPNEIPFNVNGKLVNNTKQDYDPGVIYMNNWKEMENMPTYTGPFYSGTSQNMSDDLYKDMIDTNTKNLFEFDDLVGEKDKIIIDGAMVN